MNNMTKTPLSKIWSFLSAQMTRMPTNRTEMPVLSVKYEDKDKAKQLIGAQFDPLASMWFFNRYTKWNSDLDMDGVIKHINDNGWFLGYAYREVAQTAVAKNGASYDTPVSNYTWLTQPVQESELSDRSTVSTYSWCRGPAAGGIPVVEIVILQPTNGSNPQNARMAPAAFVVVYSGDAIHLVVDCIREISMDEARKLWDVCEKNFVFSTVVSRTIGQKAADPGFNPMAKAYIEQAMAGAGTAAIYVADLLKNNIQHKTPTNYAVTA